MRNHGDSFSDPDCSFEALAGDLKNLYESLNIKSSHLIT
jgi:hypothetical protein